MHKRAAALILMTLAPLLILLLVSSCLAQEATEHSKQFELSGGPFLPSRIVNTKEILKGLDLRTSFFTSRGCFELDGFWAQGEGTVYRTVSLDYRSDLPNDVFPAFILIGVNADFFDTFDGVSHFAGGWHFGGGVFQPLTSALALREDFRYRLGPGQSLLILLGLSVTIN